MKNTLLLKLTLVLAMAGSLLLVGCNKEGSNDVKGQVAAVDTSAAETQFKDAPADVKTDLDKAITSIKSSDYKGALSNLESLAKNTKLTPEQQQALKDLIAKVQQAVTEGASKAVEGAQKAINDVKTSLPK